MASNLGHGRGSVDGPVATTVSAYLGLGMAAGGVDDPPHLACVPAKTPACTSPGVRGPTGAFRTRLRAGTRPQERSAVVPIMSGGGR